MPYNFEPIGTYYSAATYKQQAPRQGIFAEENLGIIKLLPGKNFELALRDVAGFERLWILFCFDRNEHWRPTTRPPVPPLDHDRVGVFASRSPYRPNPIGLSAVRLVSVDGLELTVCEADLLDNSPIFDIKPYIPRFDAFPEAKAGWLEAQRDLEWHVDASALFAEQARWILEHHGPDLWVSAQAQLCSNPFDASRKRVQVMEGLEPGTSTAVLSFRTWRLQFHFDESTRLIIMTAICSGYAESSLIKKEEDPYGDKDLHVAFQLWINNIK